MKRHDRSSNLLGFGGLWFVVMVVGCAKSTMVNGIRRDAGQDGPASYPDTREFGQPVATGGSTTGQGGQGGGDVPFSVGGTSGHDASWVTDAMDVGDGVGGIGGTDAAGAGGVVGADGGAGPDVRSDGGDASITAKEVGMDRFDQQPSVDGGPPPTCNGMLVFGGALPSTDVGVYPGFVALGDVNGDGKLDFVTANSAAATVSVLLGKDDGTLGAPTRFATGADQSNDSNFPAGPSVVALGDVNRDGKLDIVATNIYPGTVSVLLGKGNGTFADHVDYPAGSPPKAMGHATVPWSVALGDFDGDGHLDIVTANTASNTASILLGKGDGTFAAKVDYATGDGPATLVLGDVNGDSKLDLVVVNLITVSVMLGNGDGTLAAAVELSTGTKYHASSAALADLNGDGMVDLVLGTDEVSVMLGTGGGQFAAPVTYPTATGVGGLALGDFDGDGRPDILAQTYESLALLLGRGDGTFAPRVDLPRAYPSAAFALGDMNGDGKLDIALTWGTEPGGTASVLLGRGDGTFGQTAYAVQNETAAIEVGDLDGDGRPDVATVGRTGDSGGKLSVFWGNGDGTLSAGADYGLPGAPSLLRFADVNGDGRTDMVTASSDMTTVTVLLGMGGGTFANVETDAGTQPSAMALGDVNGDGRLDLVVAHADQTSGAGSTTVLLGQGNGTFTNKSTSPVCDGPQSVSLGDLNGDGRMDMVVACNGLVAGYVAEGGISVLLGKGDGTFAKPVGYIGAYGMDSVAMGDLNGDGKADLAVVGSSTISSVEVLLGKGNGILTTPVDFTTPWSARSVALVDINRDGKLDAVTEDDASGTSAGAGITILLGNGDGTLAPRIDYPIDARALAFGDMNGDGRLDLVAATYSNMVNVLLGSCR